MAFFEMPLVGRIFVHGVDVILTSQRMNPRLS